MKLLVALLALAAAIAIAIFLYRGETLPVPTPGAAAFVPPAPVAERSADVPPARRETAALARIEGHVTLRGEGVSAREVVLVRPDGTCETSVTGTDGAFALRVAPGHVTVGVESRDDPAPGPATHLGPKRPWLGRRSLIVSQDVEVLAGTNRCDLALPDGAIVVTVRGAVDGMPLESVEVVASEGSPPYLRRHETTDERGVVVLDELDSGVWFIMASGPFCFTSDPRKVRIIAGAPASELAITVDDAGGIIVELVDEAGSSIEISAALALEVQRAADDSVIDASNRIQRNRKPRPTQLDYGPLTAGNYLIQLADESATVDDETAWRFQPVDAVAPVIAEVFPRRTTTVSLPTRYRAYVRIFVRGAAGQVDRNSPLVVRSLDPAFAGIRILPGPWMTGARHNDAAFDGYLAPGTYRLTVQVGERTHSEHLTVGRSSLQHEIRLPF